MQNDKLSLVVDYDIRGICSSSTINNFSEIIKRFGTYLKNNNNNKISVVVGRDERRGSKEIESIAFDILSNLGIDVFALGTVHTPLVYFAEEVLGANATIMITASHNPELFSGIKLTNNNLPFFVRELKSIKLIDGNNEKKGVAYFRDIKEIYLNKILENIRIKREYKIAWDCDNGTLCPIIDDFIKKIAGEHLLINNGDIKDTIVKMKCDIGFKFDNDGDRLMVLNNEGEVISSDYLIYLYAYEISANIDKNLKPTIIVDVKISDVVIKELRKLGFIVCLSKTGHAYMKNKVREEKAWFAGEYSGHYYFPDRYRNFDDALYASIRFIEIFSKFNINLLFENIPPYYTTGEIRIGLKRKELNNTISHLRKVFRKNQNISFLDGIRYSSTKGWWLIRASNTENHLCAIVGSADFKDFSFLQKKLSKILKYNGINITW
jgi:phosphomannomutase